MQPPFGPKSGVFQLGFFETQNNDVEQQHNFKSAKNKDKKKRFQREKKTGNPKRENIDEGKLRNLIFHAVLFMKQKQRRKKRKERDKNKEAK